LPLETFKSSQPLTLGVELELQLLNLSDFDLAAASGDLLGLLSRKPFPGMVTDEITQGMIEVATGIHQSHDSLQLELRNIRDVIVRAADKLNVGVCGGGTHPFQTWPEQRITAVPRYRQVSSLYGYLAKQFTIFGQHIHVGCRDGDEALYLLHALGKYVPQFIALSASSPFSHGHDTLFDSSRLNSVYAFPLSGRAPFILEWNSFSEDYFVKMEHTGVVKSMKDFYWDIRPKPEFGTIELRVCDTPLTVDHAASLAAYLQALCHYLLDQRDLNLLCEDDYLIYNYNRFQACRFGLDGVVVDPRTYEQRMIRDDIYITLAKIASSATALGSSMMLETLEHSLINGNDATRLRNFDIEKNSPEAVVDFSATIFRSG
jgi:carboxylate-amine ligase